MNVDARLGDVLGRFREVARRTQELLFTICDRASVRTDRAVAEIRPDEAEKLRGILADHVACSGETEMLLWELDRNVSHRTKQLCDDFRRRLSASLDIGELECRNEGSPTLSLSRHAREMVRFLWDAELEVVQLLGQARAREFLQRAHAAIEFKQEAIDTADALLAGANDPSKRLAAVALIDLAWRQAAFAAANALRQDRKEPLFTHDKQLGGLGQYLYEMKVITKDDYDEFKDGDKTRNDALHATTVNAIPDGARVRKMLAAAIKFRDL